jgi:hypothetical protein
MSFEWTDALRVASEVGGLLFLVYGAGTGAKGAAVWLKKRRIARDKRLKDRK